MKHRDVVGWMLTLTAPIKPSMLAHAASELYTSDQNARYCSLPGSAKESARSVCVQSVSVGRTMARNLSRGVRRGDLE